MNWQKTTIIYLFSAIFLFSQNIFAVIETSDKDIAKLVAFVNSGIDYIKKYGTKKAYDEFSKLNGQFKLGELYLFVYDFNGTCLAHGSMPNRIGKNFLSEHDKYGTPMVQLTSAIAKSGSGFLTYYWPEPNTNKIKLKTSYIKALDNRTFIGSGIYKSVDVPQDQVLIKIEEVKAFINTGIEYFKKYGEEAAYKEFSNPNGTFIIGNKYLFVLDSKGVFLANGVYKELIGKNSFDLKDEFYTPFVQLLIEVAKKGGGSVSYYWPEPISKKIRLKICYILPLTNNTFIGSGFYGD